jgi:hypothetical protein
VTDERVLTLGEVEQALRQIDPTYVIDGDLLCRRGVELAIIELAFPGDPNCDGDLDLLYRQAERQANRNAVQAILQKCKCLVSIQPLTDESLESLWDWLLANRAGLVAFEGGCFVLSKI